MTLTHVEILAGRVFRDDAQVRLGLSFHTDPPTYKVPNWLANYRHNCSKRDGRSTAMELREMYDYSPGYLVEDGVVTTLEENYLTPDGSPLQGHFVPAKRFGFIWKQGKCRACGETARSGAGRFVDSLSRPPLQGRVARA